MTPEGKKIWDSRAGGNLIAAMLGEKPLDEKDKETLEQLKQTSEKKPIQQGQTEGCDCLLQRSNQ